MFIDRYKQRAAPARGARARALRHRRPGAGDRKQTKGRDTC